MQVNLYEFSCKYLEKSNFFRKQVNSMFSSKWIVNDLLKDLDDIIHDITTLNPKVLFCETRIKTSAKESVQIEDNYSFPCKNNMFSNIERIAIGIETLGRDYDFLVDKHSKDITRKFILDLIGNAVLFDLGIMTRNILKRRNVGFELGTRLSPGCKLIPIEAQRNILQILRAAKIGISLTESLFLKPIKSVSFIYPLLAKDMDSKFKHLSICDVCDSKAKCGNNSLYSKLNTHLAFSDTINSLCLSSTFLLIKSSTLS